MFHLPPPVVTVLKVLLGLILLVILYLFVGWPKNYPKTYGVTWSIDNAEYLGIDPYQGLTATLDDLGVRHIRLPTYWNRLEKKQGTFDWSWLDKQIEIIASRDATITLVVGIKQPRWPECWVPDWAKTLSRQELRTAQLEYVRQTVERYKHQSAITRWQIENEPSFFASFGDCGFYDPSIVADEVTLVRSLDTNHRPLTTTASGELASWLSEPKDISLGVSVYRIVANNFSNRWTYWFIPPWFYVRKAALRSLIRPESPVYVSEFQMEPWLNNGFIETPIQEQLINFDIVQMQKNITYAQRMNVPEIDFWGVEWWYWMKTKQNHPEFWEAMKKVYQFDLP